MEGCHASDHGHLVLQAVFDELTQKAESVRAGCAEEDRVGVFDLSDIAAVIGGCERREYLLNDLASAVFKRALKAGTHFMSVSKIVGDGDDLLVLKLFESVVGERIDGFCGGRGRAHKPRPWMTLCHVFRGGDT